LNVYKPNYIKYSSDSKKEGLAVLKSTMNKDGTLISMGTDILFSSRLCLRAMMVPEGKHIIEFKFEPEMIQTGVLLQ
jgi:hypothetical protein